MIENILYFGNAREKTDHTDEYNSLYNVQLFQMLQKINKRSILI